MKTKNNNVIKGMLFAGCSFTWGQGLHFYSNMATVEEPTRDAHNRFRKTLYFPRLVSNYFNTFEVCKIQNGGCEEDSFEYMKCAFGLIKRFNYIINEIYNFNEIEYIIFQTSHPQRNTYYYDYVNPNGSVSACEFKTGFNLTEENLNKFYKYLAEQKKCTIDEWYLEHCKNWFAKIKENLQFYESKGIKTLILNWEVDYMPFYKNDKWMSDRLVTFEYNEKSYDTIRTMMEKNKHLHIDYDYEYFEVTPTDNHPSKKCHRLIADAVIKKIKNKKINILL